MGLGFPKKAQRVLYLDWDLDFEEFKRRAAEITEGLDLLSVPENLFYYAPEISLPRLLPALKMLITEESYDVVVIDSLGASCVDPDKVSDVIEVFAALKNLGATTLILDHQPKMQAQDNYNQKTPYGSVYKSNLSRSVFQLSCISREPGQISLMLRHKKANFGALLDDLIFDILFKLGKVSFLESKALTPEVRDMLTILKAMKELEAKGEKVNQKAIVESLKNVLSSNRVRELLITGEGRYWDRDKGTRTELLYKSRK